MRVLLALLLVGIVGCGGSEEVVDPAGTADAGTASSPVTAAASSAETILKENCYACHGEDGVAEGGLNFVLDVGRLVERKLVVPGDAAASKLFRQVKSGNMPKDSEPLAVAEIEAVREWIDAGAEPFVAPAQQPGFISPTNILELVQADLEKVDPEARALRRYFTITHLHNAGISDTEMETYRRGLSKLVNSLSWGTKIVPPVAIDPNRTILRINLSDYLWTPDTWDLVLARNPYGVTLDSFSTAAARYCFSATRTQQPHVRADWFVARASVPPLYHEILDLPDTDIELEERLEIDVAENIEQGQVARAGFNNSGVSQNNRLIERHAVTLTGGAYWKSYDFASNKGRKAIFAHPLGPQGEQAFEHDGGEIIFSLPNGLQAYLLVDADGKRIDKGPTQIVRDPKRPDSAVVNGLSCMTCHVRGMIVKDDQVRQAVLANPDAYSPGEIAAVKAIYAAGSDLQRLMKLDADRFEKAVLQTGGKLGTTEPIVTLARRFEEDLDVDLVAAEVGLPTGEFQQRMKLTPVVARLLAPLTVPGGSVKRDAFAENFRVVIDQLGLGDSPATLVNEQISVRVLKGHIGTVNSVAFSPYEQKLASGGSDRSVRVWDVGTGRELELFLAHQEPVTAVAFDSFGRLASVGEEGLVRFDRNQRPLGADGPAATCIVFLCGGTNAVITGHRDGTIRGRPDRAGPFDALRVFPKEHDTAITSISAGLRGKFASASSDKLVLWLPSRSAGITRSRLVGHESSVMCVAFSPDDRVLASGSLDSTVKLWNTSDGTEIVSFAAHPGGVTSLAFSPNGHFLATSGDDQDHAVKIWSLREPVFVNEFAGVKQAPVTADGKPVPRLAVAPLDRAAAGRHQQAWASYLGKPVRFRNLVGMEFVLVPPGQFVMGASNGSKNASPPHRVTISRPFYLGVHEVTQKQFRAVGGGSGAQFEGPENPARMSALRADEFTHLLSKVPGEREANRVYRLPTEAEWEYACRAGTDSTFYFGNDGTTELARHGWFLENSGKETHPVGQLLPNAFGLFDMHGNVAEFCSDVFDRRYYESSPQFDPPGGKDRTTKISDSVGDKYVRRGGGWESAAGGCRCSARDRGQPEAGKLGGGRGFSGGIRVVAEIFPRLPIRVSLVASLKGHTGTVKSVAFSPDGRKLASGSADGTVRVWQLQPSPLQK
jgi:formylglycine-generating enzyme required for sulfatase activity/mono/diheme cytochrome c family protein